MIQINNLKKIRLWIGSVIAILIGITIISLLLVEEILMQIIIIFFLGISVVVCITVKGFEYEHSGECMIIRKPHPLRSNKTLLPFMEFPQSFIKDYKVKKKMMLYILTINIENDRKRSYCFNFKLMGFEEEQLIKFIHSLENIKKTNNNRIS